MTGHTNPPQGGDIGRYKLIERVAVGGMAELYLAQVNGPGGFSKKVAVKRVLPHLDDSDELYNMLLDEARIAATMQHPNLVQVYDAFEEGGEYFIAMEFLDGIDLYSLRRLLDEQRNPLPWDIVLFIATSVAAGLQYAHDKTDGNGKPLGIVHRDVTPHNIFLTRNGGVKLVDFGIAKAADRIAKTNSGALKGKLPYLAPEQCLGQTVDHRADIFALGILLYELTTRQRLYQQRSEYLLMRQIVEEKITPPSQLMPYPRELEAIVMRALAKDPADRFASAGELQTNLELYAQAANLPMSALTLQNFVRPLLRHRATGQNRPPMAEGSNRARTRQPKGSLANPPDINSKAVVSLPWSAESQPNRQRRPLPPPPGAAPSNHEPQSPRRRRAGDRSRQSQEQPNAERDALWARDLSTTTDGKALVNTVPLTDNDIRIIHDTGENQVVNAIEAESEDARATQDMALLAPTLHSGQADSEISAQPTVTAVMRALAEAEPVAWQPSSSSSERQQSAPRLARPSQPMVRRTSAHVVRRSDAGHAQPSSRDRQQFLPPNFSGSVPAVAADSRASQQFSNVASPSPTRTKAQVQPARVASEHSAVVPSGDPEISFQPPDARHDIVLTDCELPAQPMLLLRKHNKRKHLQRVRWRSWLVASTAYLAAVAVGALVVWFLTA